MKVECLLPHSQQPVICLFLEPDRSSLCPHPTSPGFILILSSHLRLRIPSGLLPSGFSFKTLYAPLLSPIRAKYPVHFSLLDLFNRMISGEEYSSWSSSLCSLLPVTSSLLGPNILLSTLFSKTLSLRSSFNVSDQVSHSYKIRGKMIVLYTLIF